MQWLSITITLQNQNARSSRSVRICLNNGCQVNSADYVAGQNIIGSQFSIPGRERSKRARNLSDRKNAGRNGFRACA
jgi:hypothetical protein